MATTWYHFLVRIRGNQLIYYSFYAYRYINIY